MFYIHTHLDYLDIKSFLFIFMKVRSIQRTLRTNREYSYEKGVNCHVAPNQPSAKVRGSLALVFACPSLQFLRLCASLSP